MGSKYSKTAFVIVLCVVVLLLSVSSGFSNTSKKHYYHHSHRKNLPAKTERISGNLVLRSASALVEDQQTGECLVQKQAAAVVPIASITKLMTAMVLLDERPGSSSSQRNS